MAMPPMAANPAENLVVDGVETATSTQETLLPNTPPSIGPVEEINSSVQSEEPINLAHKTAESNVTPVKPDLFKIVPGLLNLRNTHKNKLNKKAEKEPQLPELDLSIPSFFK